MKILLINPPIEDFYFTPSRAYPLNLLYLAASLRDRGHQVKIINALETSRQTISLPKQFEYLKQYYQPNESPFCLFDQFYHFGLSWDELSRQIKQYQPDLAGISANFSPYFDCGKQVAKLVKTINSEIITVCGGRFATVAPETVLSDENFDYCLRGEAEHSLGELASALSLGLKKTKTINKIKGLCFGQTIADPVWHDDLNKLALPAHDLIDKGKYVFNSRPMISLLASRGCKFGCEFCSVKEKFRWRSADSVLTEVKSAYQLGIRHFNFEDDNINLHPQLEKILDGLVKYQPDISISFMNGVLAKGLSNKIRKKLIKAGLTHLDLSVASCSSTLLKQMNRKEKVDLVVATANKLAKQKIMPTIHYIIGLPKQEFLDTIFDIKAISRSQAMLGPSVFYPILENQQLCQTDFRQYRFFRSSCASFTKDMNREEIIAGLYFSRIINFIKQAMDHYQISGKKFLLLIKKTSTPQINSLRQELGLYLLKLLLEQKQLYRIIKTNKGYQLVKEEFINASMVKTMFSGLKVTSPQGRKIKLSS